MKKIPILRILAFVLVLVLSSSPALALAAASGQTISDKSKWINSDIEGAIDENTPVSLRDDFHTAVNRDWILSETDRQGSFERSAELVEERKIDIVMGRAPIDPLNADAIGLGSENLAHNLDLVHKLAGLAGDWEERNALGIQPAEPYLNAIASIQTMDEMTAYLTNRNGTNFVGFSLVDITVAPDPLGSKVQMVTIAPNKAFSLEQQDRYLYMDESGRNLHYIADSVVHYVLERAGYTQQAVNEILVKGFRFEGRLAKWMSNVTQQQTVDYIQSAKPLTLEELTKLADDYPVIKELQAMGIDQQENFLVYEPDYLRRISRLYQQRYLEEIKGMCMIHTALNLITLLDEEAYARMEEICFTAYPSQAVDKQIESFKMEMLGEERPSEEEELAAAVCSDYLIPYLNEPMEQIYVAAYCTPELKAEIQDMTDQSIAFYRNMLRSVDWLSDATKEAAVEKLDSIAIRCVYPDAFTDFSELSFNGYRDEQPGTLPQAVAAIRRFQRAQNLSGAGENVDRHQWRMNTPETSTTVCNAYYAVLENSINILAGILTEEMFSPDAPYEEKLAVIGTVIGHEITHAFDTTGYRFDKDGQQKTWWTLEDKEAFDLRASRLIKYYNALTPYPGALLYDGKSVSGEAIADMGGVKCMLSIAEDIPDFDYEIFFKSYAKMWRVQRTLDVEKTAARDVHPLGFLRTNVTLQQFEKFYETFGIEPGDGMYLAPEERFSVW